MGRVWVLDTSTKGTGAQMVPLESVLREPEPAAPEPSAPVPAKRAPRPAPKPEPRHPRRFRVIDAMTREPLIDDADARATVDLLGGVRSPVGVSLYVWEPGPRRWRLLAPHAKQIMRAARPA